MKALNPIKSLLLVAALFTTSPALAKNYEGMVCDNENGDRQMITIRPSNQGPVLTIHHGDYEMTGVVLRIFVGESVLDALSRGDMEALNKSPEQSDEETTIQFKRGGLDYQGKPFGGLVATHKGESVRYSGCAPWAPAQVSW